MSFRVGSLFTGAVALIVTSMLYVGCGLDTDGLSIPPDVDASVDAPPSVDAHIDTCSDAVQDGDETDVDCGGMCTNKCPTGQHCKAGTDCQTKSCDEITKECLSPTCADGAQNGSETDVDCGGSCMTKCADGKGCGVGGDCIDGVCTMGKCAAPSCTDGVKNGSETDLDCGGSCPSCGNQKGCKVPNDCMSGHCQLDVCVAAQCTDNIKNGNETDVDCGGPDCNSCVDLKGCALARDCKSHVCTSMICQVPTCSDAVKNGIETDTDCGGGTCPKCIDGKGCVQGLRDCVDGVCGAMVCSNPTCSDGVKNGTETDVDCGSTCATKCGFTKGCNLGTDCKGGVCTSMQCAATCTDGVTNGSETDVDCGGSCPMCVNGQVCAMQSDCPLTSFCNGSGHCSAKQGLGTACGNNNAACTSGNCVDTVCCNQPLGSCNNCRACNIGGSMGTCTNVPAGSDPHNTCTASFANCKSANCAGDGTCNVPDNTNCGLSSCAGTTETDHTCTGGNCLAPTKSCNPYICGANACAVSCASDAGCQAGFYCDNTGTCSAQKGGGASCNTATQCKVAGCRECGTAGGCVDGFCCNAACGGNCQACSIAQGGTANGTCSALTGTTGRGGACSPLVCGAGPGCPGGCASDSDCIAGDFCNAAGVCTTIKTQGGTCNLVADCKVAGCRECGANPCVDGFCCNSACGGNCQACSIAQGGTVNGTCAALTGTTGRGGACSPLVCGAGPGCPGGCGSDSDCIAGDFCNAAGSCQTIKIPGGTCNLTTDCKVMGCRECGANSCVDGFCCDNPCNGSCQACSVAAGASANGTCTNVAAGSTGRPTCSPFVCNGNPACPSACSDDPDCATGFYCDNTGACAMQKVTLDPCDTTADCKVAGCRECTVACVAGACL